MPKILVVVDAPGPADSILPVLPILKKSAEVALITVGDSPSRILADFNPLRCDRESDTLRFFQKIKPDLLFATTSSLVVGPYIVAHFTKHAAQAGTPIVCLQDYWANHRNPQNSLVMKYWSVMLVQDKLAEKFLIEDNFPGKIIVTGNPALDNLRDIKVPFYRAMVRGDLGLSDGDYVITYIGRGTPQSVKEDILTFKFIAETLRGFSEPPALIIRPHPRDEAPERYREMSSGLHVIDASTIADTNSLIAASDLIIGMDSTAHLHACYLRIPNICLILPEAGKVRLAKVGLDDFPPAKVGATTGIYENDFELLKFAIERVRRDPTYLVQMRDAQARFFPMPDGRSAERVAEEVLKMVN